ncbi:MAG: carboxypeptidase regulatory-like domain-containing protein [Bryobacteraceae bacterium]|nr:carboxypeptidase regulatory-like domain-containing protein [Bryobacteraceae bacterium]MDW8380126.1 carboxypeptidase regulatory-like domain-containing protein [Bryobacterales bacterium]
MPNQKFVLSLLLCLLSAHFLNAQTDSASIRVLVVDPSDSAVVGATVQLRNTSTSVQWVSTTSNDGYAVFSPLVRGTYELEVSQRGFKSVKLTGIQVNVDERRLVRVPLEVATVSETIEVSATIITTQTEQASLGQVISGRTAVELPLAGRRYTELALLAPGVANANLNPVTRGPGWFVSNGNYHTQNNFLLDGVDNNQGTTNAQALSAQVVQPSPDSIAEFKVQTNSYSAEFGRSAGGVVNVSLKSGTNELHGSAWYFNRDAALAARGWNNNLLNLPKANLGWHQFGGTLGGPIKRNKLFYFGAYEGFRQSFSDTFLVTVPTAEQRRGVFALDILDPASNALFPNRTIPASRFDALGKRLVDLYPDPNQAGQVQAGRPANNYSVQRDGRENTHKFDTRTDYYLNDRNQFMARFSFLRQEFNRDQIFPGIADGVGNQGRQYNDNQSLALMWTRTISPTLINTFRYGLNRTFAEFAHATVNAEKADAFGFRGIPPELLQVGGLPLISVTNYRELGTRNFRPQFQRPYLNQILNTVSIVSGKHFIRTGFEGRFKNNTFIDVTRRTPAYSFQGRYTNDAMADLLLGLPEVVQLNTVPEVNQLQRAWSLFIQDDYKVSPVLTLNLGMRYEYTTPFYGSGRNVNINFDPRTQGLLIAGRDGNDRYLVTPDRNNFGPRLGLAWQPIRERLVFRVGYGIFYNSEDIYGSEANLPLNPPQLIQANLIRVAGGPPPIRLSDPIPSGVLSNFDSRLVTLRTREREQRSGLIQQWNVALQFQVSRASTFEMAYVGNNGRNLFGLYERNQTPFGVDGTVAANRPFPLWQGIQTGATRAQSKYNAFQTKFEHNYAAGLYVLAAYTWASALDQAGAWDAGASPQYLDRFDQEWGRMSQTPIHRYTTAVSYDLPFGKGKRFGANWSRGADFVLGGWKVSSIVSWRSGLPINVTLNANGINPATGQAYRFLQRNGGGLRPDRVGKANTGISPKENRFNFLDVNAYRVQTINTAGNAARNSAYGPRQFNTDFALRKEFRVTERHAAEFRWESFNFFNTVNFANPATVYGNINFGFITSAGDARVMQLALRFQF